MSVWGGEGWVRNGDEKGDERGTKSNVKRTKLQTH